MFGGSLGASIGITSKLAAEQRPALEQLLFFNVNQYRVRVGIQQSIDTYGVPEIYERDGALRVRVGDIAGVQTLFAISEVGKPLGVAVFVRSAHERFAVLHLGVDPKLDPEPLIFKSVGEGSQQLNYAKVYSGLYEFEGHVVP